MRGVVELQLQKSALDWVCRVTKALYPHPFLAVTGRNVFPSLKSTLGQLFDLTNPHPLERTSPKYPLLAHHCLSTPCCCTSPRSCSSASSPLQLLCRQRLPPMWPLTSVIAVPSECPCIFAYSMWVLYHLRVFCSVHQNFGCVPTSGDR